MCDGIESLKAGVIEIRLVMERASRHQTGMLAIAVFKLFKGGLLLLVGFGLLELMHADLANLFSLLLETLHINADTRLVHALMLKVEALQPHSILVAGLISLAYAALLLAEGIGLWLEVSWAAYVTVVSTSALIPFEVYELYEGATVSKIVLLAVNLVIVLYLIKQLKQHTLRRSPKNG
jgi:uncharacterized membrane protein (DUF2068 family)